MNAALGPRNGASSTTASDGGGEVRRWRVPLLAVIAGLVFCAFASSASASFLYYRSGGGSEDLVYAGLTNGERNVVTEQLSGGQFLYTETGGSTISGWPDFCLPISAVQVACSTEVAHGVPLTTLSFEMHNNDDSVDARTSLPTTIEGGAGADDLKGGSGADTIQGDGDFDPDPDGDDTIDGRGGADSMYGDDGTDTVTYASRTPSVFVTIDGIANDGGGGEGDNVQPTVENLVGSKSADQLTGDGSANVLTGGLGGDDLDGLGGDDTLNGSTGNDQLDGGPGLDRLSGMDGADLLVGGLDNDRLFGGADRDGGIGGAGADNMSGGDGSDYVDYSAVAAPLKVTVADGAANDGAAGEGDNVQPDNEIVFGGSGDDRLYGPDGSGELWGRDGADQLFGGNSDDRLEGEGGDDRLEGGYRGDVLNGGGGVDTVDYSWHSVTDPDTGEVFGVSSTPNGIADDGNFSVDEGLAGTDNVGADVENVSGSDGPDYIEGTADANRLRGAGNDDHLLGMGGSDLLEGETGGDELEGGTEADVLRGGDQADRLTGGSEDDVLDGGTDADTLIGQAASTRSPTPTAAAPVAVTLDGLRNDGADPNSNGVSSVAEEHDLDRTVENAIGGDAGDILRAPLADGVVNVLRGVLGNDTLNAREGTGTVDSLLCGPGADGFAKDPADLQVGCETALP